MSDVRYTCDVNMICVVHTISEVQGYYTIKDCLLQTNMRQQQLVIKNNIKPLHILKVEKLSVRRLGGFFLSNEKVFVDVYKNWVKGTFVRLVFVDLCKK